MRSGQVADNRFLIVDHHPFLRDTLRRTLLSMGATSVDTVASAGPAIGRCRDAHYDVILADYDLGAGKNGQQLLEDLRNERLLPNASGFMILTADTARDVVLATLEHAPDDFLAKPYPPHLLMRRLRRLVKFKHRLHPVFASVDRGELEVAIEGARNYLQRESEFSASVRRLLAQLHLWAGEYEEAEALARQELAGEEADWARMTLARVQQLRGESAAAERGYLGLIESNYLYVEAYEYLAQLYLSDDAPEKAEAIMARAVLVSPRSLSRRRFYAALCERNNHLETAASAWREVIKLARHGRHDGPVNHLGLSRTLTDRCALVDDFPEELAGEAMRQLEYLRSKFRPWGDSQIQSLCLEGRLLLGRGDDTKGRACLVEAGRLLSEHDQAQPESLLEYAKVLSQAGEVDEARAVLERLLDRCPQDAAVAAAADKVLDDPVSGHGKRRIVDLNRAGISSFRGKDYRAARLAFAQAHARFPRNIELNLNLVQALLALIREYPDGEQREQWLTDAERCYTLIGDIPVNHPKLTHYQRLKQELQKLQTR